MLQCLSILFRICEFVHTWSFMYSFGNILHDYASFLKNILKGRYYKIILKCQQFDCIKGQSNSYYFRKHLEVELQCGVCDSHPSYLDKWFRSWYWRKLYPLLFLVNKIVNPVAELNSDHNNFLFFFFSILGLWCCFLSHELRACR